MEQEEAVREPACWGAPREEGSSAQDGRLFVVEELQDGYAQFLAAAARVPEALPTAAPLCKDLRVVLNLRRGLPGETSVLAAGAAGAAPPPLEEYDGAPGTIVSEAADQTGRWLVEVTRRGDAHRLAVPRWHLLWCGAPVVVQGLSPPSSSAPAEAGLVAAERPDRDTGRWQVKVHKTLALLPQNLRAAQPLGSMGGQAGSPAAAGAAQLSRGQAVELHGLTSGSIYNGLTGLVLSPRPNAQGRWEISVARIIPTSRENLWPAGAAPPTGQVIQEPAGTTVGSPAPAPTDIQIGDEVEICGLVGAPQHNGRRATVVERSSTNADRLRVRCMDSGASELLLDLRPCNLQKQMVVPDVPAASRQSSPGRPQLPPAALPRTSGSDGAAREDAPGGAGGQAAEGGGQRAAPAAPMMPPEFRPASRRASAGERYCGAAAARRGRQQRAKPWAAAEAESDEGDAAAVEEGPAREPPPARGDPMEELQRRLLPSEGA